MTDVTVSVPSVLKWYFFLLALSIGGAAGFMLGIILMVLGTKPCQ